MFLQDGKRAFGIGLGAMRYDIVADLDAAATVGGTPVMRSTSGFSICSTKVRA